MNAPGRILPDLSVVVPLKAHRGRSRTITVEEVAELAKTLDDETIAERLGCSVATVRIKRLDAGIRRPTGRKRIAGRSTSSRFQSKPVEEKPAVMPPVNHPALSEARTVYPSTVVPVEGLLNVLVSGHNAWKIGDRIAKGPWRGFPIFTLTLEERATCPTSCAHWRSCYGNHMNWAKRIVHGPAFEERLGHELAILQSRYPKGFAIRLHVLGDFYSVAYVDLWRSFLGRFPALHVFGFTARWDGKTDPIARTLIDLVAEQWDRFAIRFSNAPIDECSTISIEHPVQKPDDAVICPQQMGQTASCGTCGFCWHSKRRVAFLRH